MNIHQVASRVKNGKKVFYFRWSDPETGKRRERSAKTKKEAEAMRRDLVAKWLNGNLPTEKSRQTVARVVEAYLDAREDDVRANNITRGQFDNIRVYMKPWAAWADRSIGQIDPAWVKAALDGLAVGGSTKRKYLVGWGGFAKWIMLHGYRNDLITMHCRVAKVAKPEMWFPPDETVKALLATSDGKWRAIIATLAMCGLRCGEIRALPWENVSINGGYIKVRQAVERYGRIAGPKTEAGNREVPLPAFVGSMYADLPRRGDLVFPRDDGTPMT
ncbi:MAG: tyrosine-type recombinase/integrase, partial [Alphaproteobacteria bacterium]